tara:strand:+ start:249 stop:518 length:270 start_codon:yes stop_codon:yes gene_type:complete
MAYKMKGPSLLKMVEKEKKHFLERNKVGPIADKKEIKDDNVPLSPGFEDPIKIQKLQREGLTPGSQKFIKKDQDEGFIDYEDSSDPDKG